MRRVLRVGFDMTPAITGGTGIARYVIELSAALEDAGVDVRRFAVGRASEPVPPDTRHVRMPLRVVGRSWSTVGRPRVESLVGPVDLVHASGPVLPASRAPRVSVFYDLAPLDHPDLHPPRAVAQLRHQVASLDRVAGVVAISTTTAEHLVGYGVPAERIVVTPCGHRALPPGDEPALAGRTYVLAVGQLVPRKGLDVLVQAMARLDPAVHLALVGPSDGEEPELRRIATALGIAERVHFAGRVSDAALAGWYAHAWALAAPSIEEGFGLPLLEAMATGLPVVASDIAVFREITGGHASFVPVGDVGALAAALTALLEDPVAHERLVAAGRAQAASFTWERCAEITLATYHRILT
ncbi:glycosyltransferase family 1 protein [soil metagenome]